MYSESVCSKLHAWAEQGISLLRELLPLMSPVLQYEAWTTDERETLAQLLSACARSGESALLLSAYGQLWDADILVRSVAEGSLKFCHLLQDREKFKQRHREYSHDLFRIAIFKNHKKAAELLAMLSNTDSSNWEPIRELLISDKELEEIGRQFGKAQRRALDTKWGFTGLIGEFARSDDIVFRGFSGLAHNYSMASHILHVDSIGASLPIERDRRSLERRESIHLAHGARLISDVFTFLKIRLAVGYRFIRHDMKPVTDAWQFANKLGDDLRASYKDWITVEYPERPPPSTRAD